MRTHPQSEFFIFDSVIYYNSEKHISGAFTSSVKNVPSGFISLYEYNIDKLSGSNNFIYPWIYKDSARASLRASVSTGGGTEAVTGKFGDKLIGSYPLSSSIMREYMVTAGERRTDTQTGSSPTDVIGSWLSAPTYPHYFALKNALDFYGARSKHYKITGSAVGTSYDWIKDQQTINLISIPEIFYGSEIKPGSVSLKWYFTGSLIGELQDTKRNGELIQINTSSNPALPDNSGSVAGVVMYQEGFVLLTGSWALNTEEIGIIKGDTSGYNPKWIYFGAGAQDNVLQPLTVPASFNSASFELSFKGTTETQVMTMFAHAKKGEINYSNNPTFLEFGQDELKLTSSLVYEENSDRVIKNTVSSSHTDYSGSFKRQVYVSRVGIYDDNKNLIGIATLANPVRKQEDQDLTFKIRLDI